MNENERRVRAALASLLEPVAPRDELPAATLARARRRSRATGVAATAAAVLLVSAVAWAGIGTTRRDPPPPASADAGPHLFLSGKYGELWRVGIDGEVVHARVPELDPGDPPYHLLARGRALVGWGYETYLLDPGLDDPPEVLVEDSLFFLPSAHEDRVWVTIEEPGTNRRIAAVREVSVDGRVTVADAPPPDGEWPAGAVAGGLLFHRDGSWVVWDPEERAVVSRFSARDLGPTHGDLVASCAAFCHDLDVLDVETTERSSTPPPDGFEAYAAWEARFSPDGKAIAVPVSNDAGETHLALVDVSSETATVVAGTSTTGFRNLIAWSADGEHVFFTGDGSIFVYEVGAAAARHLDVEVGEFFSAAAI